ncbi:MAG: hypothetical protein IPM66_24775 [Acidobacteriota bacterium]|nr:MAG: hypothetical protein IPM66_24775 [Acidobacteriota bacterium]
MRRFVTVAGIIALLQVLTLSVTAQDKLVGRWEGKISSMQGERPTAMVIKKNGEEYTGRSQGMRPGQEIELKEFKIDGDKVTAKADVETPQAMITINYTFTLAGEAMKGQGAIDFGGQSFTFDLDLKRVSADTEAPLTAAQPAAQAGGAGSGAGQGAGQGGGQARGQQGGGRRSVEQPQQKQSIDYFVGKWSFRYIGRESGLGPAPREGVVVFTKRADGRSVEGMVEGTHDGGAYKESIVISFDEAAKMLNYTEKLSSGVVLNSRGDWSSPIAIRFTIEPVQIKGQKLQLKRTISIVAAHSFTVTEELSEDGGPFIRLGNAVFSKVE